MQACIEAVEVWQIILEKFVKNTIGLLATYWCCEREYQQRLSDCYQGQADLI